MTDQRRDHGSVQARQGKATRIDPDVAAAVEARRGTRSFAATVNDLLRPLLLDVPVPTAAEPSVFVAAPQPMARPPARLTTRRSSTRRCPHPPGRRIGDRCGACGATVRSTR